ncbi:MAG: haloalkane dehalogenase [Polyangiales bacterium]
MDILRTPDERFASLPGYSFAPHYVDIGALRVHYVDEGPRDAAPILLLHGEPSWSYLYRRMIEPLVAAGHRVVAPDLVGFGRSDKPAKREDYTYQRHVDWMADVLSALDLKRVTLFCQDWGGLIGLRLAAEHGDRFTRIVAANTFLPTGDQKTSEAFFMWREFSQSAPEFPIGGVVRRGCARSVADDVVAAYDAPFPDESFKAGARQFPALVPVTPDDPASAPNRAAWAALTRWTKPFVTMFSDKDPITAGADAILQAAIPGARGQAHTTIRSAGHFLQEDAGEEIAAHLVELLR